MTIRSKEQEAAKVSIIVDRDPVSTSFEKWAQPGHFSRTLAKGPKTTTWPKGITQEVHYSESKALHENNPKEKPQAHSYLINALPNTYELDLDIMVEAKGKELAILPFIKIML